MNPKNILISIFSVVFLDQLTKTLFTNKQYSILGFPIISYTENSGAAFSILEGYRLFFIALAVVALVVLFYYASKINRKDTYLHVTLGILIGGIIGNLIDRIILGYVRDFVYLKIWPTFNIADASMFIAIGLLIIYFVKKKDKSFFEVGYVRS